MAFTWGSERLPEPPMEPPERPIYPPWVIRNTHLWEDGAEGDDNGDDNAEKTSPLFQQAP